MIANVGFTGTRNGMTIVQREAVERWLYRLHEHIGSSFHHGDCVGSDAEAHVIAYRYDYRIVVHPPVDQRYRAFMKASEYRDPADFIARDHHIVDESDWMVAAPKGMKEELRSGTWATIRYALKQECPIVICYPDGSCDLNHIPGFHHNKETFR